MVYSGLSMNADYLISSIKTAFDGVPRSDTSLRQFRLTDRFGMSREITDSEWDAAGFGRTDTRWQEIPDSEIQECGVLLAHMQARDFLYYLPAYMLKAVRDIQDGSTGSEIVGSFVSCVYPSNRSTSSRAYTLSQLSLLTQPQWHAISEFLKFVAEFGDDHDRAEASKVIQRFWTHAVVDHGINASIIQKP